MYNNNTKQTNGHTHIIIITSSHPPHTSDAVTRTKWVSIYCLPTYIYKYEISHIHTRKDVLVLLSRIHPVHDDREMEWMDGSELFLSSFHVHGVLYVCFVLHDGELVRDGRPWCVCVCVYV